MIEDFNPQDQNQNTQVPEQSGMVDNGASQTASNVNVGQEPQPGVIDNSQVPPVGIPPVQTVQNNLPPSPPPITLSPQDSSEVVVVNTQRAKGTSNFILVVLVLLLGLFVWNIDAVLGFVQKNIITTNPTQTGTPSNNNLVDGFIKISESTSSYTINEIKFYNFSRSGNNKLLLNYVSSKNYKDVSELKMYIEIYSSNKELLLKKLFDAEKVENSAVGSFIIDVDEQIYTFAYLAKIKVYTEDELKSKQVVTCTYNDSNENYLLEYKNIYSFTNNELSSYEVNKKVEVINDNKVTAAAKSVLKNESDRARLFEIPTTFENNILNYKVNLETVNEGYSPLYVAGTAPSIVKISETNKKWICE